MERNKKKSGTLDWKWILKFVIKWLIIIYLFAYISSYA